MLWKDYTSPPPKDKGVRLFGSCGIVGYMNFDGTLDSGEKIKKMIVTLKDRENGLGAGFAAYGIFPDYAEYYCLQFLFDTLEIKNNIENYLNSNEVNFTELNTFIDPAVRGKFKKKYNVLLVYPSHFTATHPWNIKLDNYLGEVWNYDHGSQSIIKVYKVKR